MSITVAGFVKNGVVVPNAPLPEGAAVQIHFNEVPPVGQPVLTTLPTPTQLRRMPREQRQAILAAAAEMAEVDYRSDMELTGFEAFGEEEVEGRELLQFAGAVLLPTDPSLEPRIRRGRPADVKRVQSTENEAFDNDSN